MYNILTPFIHAFNPPFASYELWFALKSIGLITEFGIRDYRIEGRNLSDDISKLSSSSMSIVILLRMCIALIKSSKTH